MPSTVSNAALRIGILRTYYEFSFIRSLSCDKDNLVLHSRIAFVKPT